MCPYGIATHTHYYMLRVQSLANVNSISELILSKSRLPNIMCIPGREEKSKTMSSRHDIDQWLIVKNRCKLRYKRRQVASTEDVKSEADNG